MHDPYNDTIAAVASGVGGAVGIIRLSGPQALSCGGRLWQGRGALVDEPCRKLVLGHIMDGCGHPIDAALAVHFHAGSSYTGEPVVEFHCHGGTLVIRQVMAALFSGGVRQAEAGEFTKRAFLNGRLDLTQAEAVADVIGAKTAGALRVAERLLDGGLRRRLEEVYRQLQVLLSEIESQVDFSEEHVPQWPADQFSRECLSVEQELTRLVASRYAGQLLRQGIKAVIAGGPNVGKSSLLNAILGRERAIVTPIPGTTRDTLEEAVNVRNIPVCFVDTAGIRTTSDPVEESGIERTHAALRTADLILWVIDASAPESAPAVPVAISDKPWIPIFNKVDLVPPGNVPATWGDRPALSVSAARGSGVEGLFDAIEKAIGHEPVPDDDIAVNERHAILLDSAGHYLRELAAQAASERWELSAVAARCALADVGRVLGKTHAPDVLETIFARFCIGK